MTKRSLFCYNVLKLTSTGKLLSVFFSAVQVTAMAHYTVCGLSIKSISQFYMSSANCSRDQYLYFLTNQSHPCS